MKEQYDLVHEPEQSLLLISGEGHNTKYEIVSSVPDRTLVVSNQWLLSDNLKMVVSIDNTFYHSLVDNLYAIIYFHEKYGKDIDFILRYDETKARTAKDFILRYLFDNNISYIRVPITDAPIAVNAKNFCYLNLKYVTSKKQIQRLSKEFIGAARERAQEPTKKIYLSRRAAVEALIKTFNEPVDITKYPSYRIDDEAELEDFFKSNGYEIVYPEDFNSMEEQISYMQQVKVFVSISGSGFLNQLFMNSDTHVMELMPESDLPSQILKFIEALDQEFYLVQHNGVAKDLINTLMNDVNFQYITSMGTND